MDVRVKVLKTFPYRGWQCQRGDVIGMDPDDATFYQRYGLVAQLSEQQTYQTRELTAR